GLGAALGSSLARNGPRAALVVEPEVSAMRWNDRLEATAYFCCTQAIMFGRLRRVRLTSPTPDVLEIALGGAPLAAPARESMLDRVEAWGGTLDDEADSVLIRLSGTPQASVLPVG